MISQKSNMVQLQPNKKSDSLRPMHITAGLGSIDDYPAFAEAGAEELFCGYVPFSWCEKYGILGPLNRREVLFYNVQIGSETELMILRRMRESYHVPVTITLNALYYTPQQYPVLADYMLHCRQLGFDRFIIADHALLVYLQQQGLTGLFHLHISGEIGQQNVPMLSECRSLGAERMIFHRKVQIGDMKQMTASEPAAGMEFEAFIMNEMCHFHGGFCNSLHCDELAHMCHVPYRLGKLEANPDLSGYEQKEQKAAEGAEKRSGITECTKNRNNHEIGNNPEIGNMTEIRNTPEIGNTPEVGYPPEDLYIPGLTGCGLCALPELQMAGVTWLKVVSRGGYADETIEDIRALKRAIRICEEMLTETEARRSNSKVVKDKTEVWEENLKERNDFLLRYRERMKRTIFPAGCSENCYYL